MIKNKQELIKELWQKYSYKDNQGYKSDRSKIIKDYERITGETIANSTISNYTSRFNKEMLYVSGEPVDKNEEFVELKENHNGTITSTIKKRMREKLTFTNRELLELHTINPDENQIKQIVSNEYTMTNRDGETFYNFQSKIIAVPIIDQGISFEEFIKLMKQDPEPMSIKTVGVGTRYLSMGLADLHFGRTPWELIEPILFEILDIVENGYDTITIAQLGDLFESSQMKQSITLAGTVLPTVDMAIAWADAKRFFHTLIEYCLKYAKKVIIEHACGNHSGNLEYVFMDGLKDRYSLLKNKRVVVNNHNDYRTVTKFGNIGIMLSHGDTVKLKDLPLKFASEYPLIWGNVEHRECWSGHKHNQFTISDVDGTVMRQFPTPKPPTDYEDKWGYNSRELVQLVEFSENSSKVIYEINGLERI